MDYIPIFLYSNMIRILSELRNLNTLIKVIYRNKEFYIHSSRIPPVIYKIRVRKDVLKDVLNFIRNYNAEAMIQLIAKFVGAEEIRFEVDGEEVTIKIPVYEVVNEVYKSVGESLRVGMDPKTLTRYTMRLVEIRKSPEFQKFERKLKELDKYDFELRAIPINIHSHPNKAFISEEDKLNPKTSWVMIIVPNYGKGITIDNFLDKVGKEIVVGIPDFDPSLTSILLSENSAVNFYQLNIGEKKMVDLKEFSDKWLSIFLEIY